MLGLRSLARYLQAGLRRLLRARVRGALRRKVRGAWADERRADGAFIAARRPGGASRGGAARAAEPAIVFWTTPRDDVRAAVNALLPCNGLEHFDGFSIGSNDLTAADAGWAATRHDSPPASTKRDPAVRLLIARAIAACRAAGKKPVGIMTQGPTTTGRAVAGRAEHRLGDLEPGRSRADTAARQQTTQLLRGSVSLNRPSGRACTHGGCKPTVRAGGGAGRAAVVVEPPPTNASGSIGRRRRRPRAGNDPGGMPVVFPSSAPRAVAETRLRPDVTGAYRSRRCGCCSMLDDDAATRAVTARLPHDAHLSEARARAIEGRTRRREQRRRRVPGVRRRAAPALKWCGSGAARLARGAALLRSTARSTGSSPTRRPQRLRRRSSLAITRHGTDTILEPRRNAAARLAAGRLAQFPILRRGGLCRGQCRLGRS